MSSLIDSLRTVRLGGIAVFDVIASCYILGWLNERYGTGSFRAGVFWAVPLGIVVHYAFGIPTTLNKMIGLA